MSKSIIFPVKSFLGNFYRHLVIFLVTLVPTEEELEGRETERDGIMHIFLTKMRNGLTQVEIEILSRTATYLISIVTN